MKIRKGIPEDIHSLTILFDNYRVFYQRPSDLKGANEFLTARFTHKESVIFVAENYDYTLMGFVQLYPLFSSTRMQRLWLLNDLYVRPEHRGQGVSIALIDACKTLCRSTKSCGMILETAKDNAIGNNLYHKTGFTADNEHNYFEWSIESEPI